MSNTLDSKHESAHDNTEVNLDIPESKNPLDEPNTDSPTTKATPPKSSPADSESSSKSAKRQSPRQKRTRIRFEIEITENQIETIFRGTFAAKSPPPIKVGTLRSIISQIKATDLQAIVMRTLGSGVDRTHDHSDSDNDSRL